ncbi:MAG: metal-dependent transcriptional regulator [Spirochaetaceae bacterium]|nr:metal-dependent transcriptional regulator [Spirochaetaceae bacterium]MBO4727602.1 metal-dependent transcriptional regulator [Spirochaetaceae bacterium]MBR4826074.1 metal-dependent transcriptional regulator [Spirochaetaceae bacterium]
MKILESAEDYLESILMLKEKNGYVRSIDVATELGVTRPSVSYAMKRLRENNYILFDESDRISLTEKGLEIAERIYTRHKVLTKILVNLGVDEKTARQDACKIEHDISQESFDALLKHLYKYSDEK